jgi:hypothetical protein
MHKNQHFDTMDLAITAAIQGLGSPSPTKRWWQRYPRRKADAAF